MSKTVKDYEALILAYHQVIINAPAGSQKTQWVIKCLSKKGKVLLVVSRKSIRNQSQIDADYCHCKNITIIHQWQIEANSINLDDYNYVVVDECHLFLSDTFAEAAWYLERFIRGLPSHITLIMMSAVAERPRAYIEKHIVPGIHYLDLRGKVDGVKPKSAFIITYKTAMAKLRKSDRFHRTVYFCSSAKDVYRLEETLLLEGRTDVQGITSQPEKRTKSQQRLANREKKVQDCIDRTGVLPSCICIFITTSKNREGVNFNDHKDQDGKLTGEKITLVISELKDYVSMIQIAARVRHGVEEYCLVSDKGSISPFYYLELKKTVVVFADDLNAMLNCIKSEGKQRESMIKDLEAMAKKYRSLIIFADEQFHVSQGMIAEIEMRLDEHNHYHDNLEQMIADIVEVEDMQGIFDTIVKPFLNRKICPGERAELLALLKQAGFRCGQLPRILNSHGYELTHAKDYRWYMITKNMGFTPMGPLPI